MFFNCNLWGKNLCVCVCAVLTCPAPETVLKIKSKMSTMLSLSSFSLLLLLFEICCKLTQLSWFDLILLLLHFTFGAFYLLYSHWKHFRLSFVLTKSSLNSFRCRKQTKNIWFNSTYVDFFVRVCILLAIAKAIKIIFNIFAENFRLLILSIPLILVIDSTYTQFFFFLLLHFLLSLCCCYCLIYSP